MPYDFRSTEETMRAFWAHHKTYQKAKEQASGPNFYFLDGPPYTSGKVHIGTAWNKTLKDEIIRYKRMRGYAVWDRAGYDMHGLPTENATEKELGIKGRQQVDAYGKEKFIEECRKLCVRNLREMNKVFEHLGVWMDFDNAYQTISKRWMEGEWWLLKRAHENGRLYEGERSMTWDMHAATALAKHELVYQTVTDTSIYVRFKRADDEAYLIVWTTTPWTIPFNLAVMVHPKLAYCKVRLTHEGEEQTWWIAKDRLEPFLEHELKTAYSIEEEVMGEQLAGVEYEHPLAPVIPELARRKASQPNVHTVVLSEEFVDTSAGTGLVHCAPGCGPEDFEVGYRNDIKPYNTINEHGYAEDLGPFTGLRAREQDREFIDLIERHGALVHTLKYKHEYPFGERSKEPVIFRVTKQWFLKVEDMKERMIAENNQIQWVPEAAYNAFTSWLENLRDNSISRQRYWGTPLPIWRNTQDSNDYFVVENAAELKELAGLVDEPEDLHIPTVDPIIIERDGKEYRRVPDVLDVWVDAGTASWNCLDFPREKERFEELFPADFILEGKDQIRGWFNLLHVASMVALHKPAFKACYMHGFVNDAQGRKMSKSVGNYILPEEVTHKYGVDATRYYMISAANPGFDMNYNFEDLEAKFKNLIVYWNIHQYLIDMCAASDITPMSLSDASLELEEEYILSLLHTTITKATEAMDAYRLNELPLIVERFLMELSRTYIQLVREKVSSGTEEEKQAVASTLAHCTLTGITMLAPVVPFVAEHMYQNLRERFPNLCVEESVHLRRWPEASEDHVNAQLEADMLLAQDAISAILAAREKAQLGVRWPIKEVRIACKDPAPFERLTALILSHTNVKALSFDAVPLEYELKPNYKEIGKTFGQQTAEIIPLIGEHKSDLVEMLEQGLESVSIAGNELTTAHLEVIRHAAAPWQLGEGSAVRIFLDTTRTPELESEGFAREVTRRIQQLRKEAGLVKKDRVRVAIASDHDEIVQMFAAHKTEIAQRTGADEIELVASIPKDCAQQSDAKIKGVPVVVGIWKN